MQEIQVSPRKLRARIITVLTGVSVFLRRVQRNPFHRTITGNEPRHIFNGISVRIKMNATFRIISLDAQQSVAYRKFVNLNFQSSLPPSYPDANWCNRKRKSHSSSTRSRETFIYINQRIKHWFCVPLVSRYVLSKELLIRRALEPVNLPVVPVSTTYCLSLHQRTAVGISLIYCFRCDPLSDTVLYHTQRAESHLRRIRFRGRIRSNIDGAINIPVYTVLFRFGRRCPCSVLIHSGNYSGGERYDSSCNNNVVITEPRLQ